LKTNITYITTVGFHILIGILIYLNENLAKVYFFAALVYFMYRIFLSASEFKTIEVLKACAYFVGAEIFFRMTRGGISYEAGKHLVIVFGFEHSHESLNLFNLSCDTDTTVTRIAEMVVEEMGLNNVQFNYTGGSRGWKGDVPRFQLDAKKINTLGWKARYTSDDAVRKAIQEVLNSE